MRRLVFSIRRAMSTYVYQHYDWPHFMWDNDMVLMYLADVRFAQGKLMGKLETLGFEMRENAQFEMLSLEVLKSAEIEGELYKPDEVRSSVARKLGLDKFQNVQAGKHVDGVVEMVYDALTNFHEPLTKERLFAWHAALFPTGYSGMYQITVGQFRVDSTGPMQVVSGALGKERVHFQAPHSDLLPTEMEAFLEWFNEDQGLDLVLKAGVAHFWFLTLHPFEDGNGRIARALTDLLLARSDKSTQQFYSLSAQLLKERKAYYELLEKCQKGDMDLTNWLLWFLNCFHVAVKSTNEILNHTLQKAAFWKTHSQTLLNDRQLKVVNRLLDEFEGNLTSTKWAKMCKCSQDTALRDLNDLLRKKVLKKNDSGGRSTHYSLVLTD